MQSGQKQVPVLYQLHRVRAKILLLSFHWGMHYVECNGGFAQRHSPIGILPGPTLARSPGTIPG